MTALNDDFQSLALLSIQPKDSQRDSQKLLPAAVCKVILTDDFLFYN